MQPTHVAYSALIVLNMMLGALATQLGGGKVPIPAGQTVTNFYGYIVGYIY